MAKTVGILGGMGPMSTVDLMRKVTEKTPVLTEREHLRLLVDSRPQIPDRPAAIFGTGPSPVPMLQESARLLEAWGADLIAMPCNTVHAFLDDVRAAVSIEVLDMIGLVGRALSRELPEGAAVGLLATTAAGKARIFHDRLPRFTLVTPGDADQEELVTGAILQVKLEDGVEGPREKLLKAVDGMNPIRGRGRAGHRIEDVQGAVFDPKPPQKNGASAGPGRLLVGLLGGSGHQLRRRLFGLGTLLPRFFVAWGFALWVLSGREDRDHVPGRFYVQMFEGDSGAPDRDPGKDQVSSHQGRR
ncbi:aspartate/glutamate racemase family protein [Gemmatimonadota bacterium]